MRVLTWNIAEHDLSTRAPSSWTREKKTQKIAEIISQHNPDVIALQEVVFPDLLDFLHTAGYSALKETPSHSGNTILLFKEELEEFLIDVFKVGYSIGCTFVHPQIGVMAFVACHLPPFAQNKEIRAKQLTNVVQFLRPKTSRIIIAGDMNMRKAENIIVTQLELDDAFILGNSPKKYQFSWDGYTNPFHINNHPSTCRFDRVFLQDFKVTRFQFVGETPVTPDSDHFLSDHFGLLVDINPA